MNEKFKLIFADASGKTMTVTENHPKLDSTAQDKEDAMVALSQMLGDWETVRIDLNSDTTVWQAD